MSYGKSIKLAIEDQIGVVTVDLLGHPMNTWTDDVILEASALLDDLEARNDIKGLVFISGKPGNFHAGANLDMLKAIASREDAFSLLGKLHGIFNRIESLPYPTLAAIDGHCLGGGLEFALACNARIAKDNKSTVLGLPECNLGIFPGAGGTQRLPLLIGLPAMELILKSAVFSASKALAMGVVDKLVPADDDLLTSATRFLREIIANTAELKRVQHDFSDIDAAAEQVQQAVLKATRGRKIPGHTLAIASMRDGLKAGLQAGLKIEISNFADAVVSNQAKGSIHTFFLKTMSDKPKSMMTKGFKPKALNKVAILGFGTMGRGIAVNILKDSKMQVVVKEIPEAIEAGKEFVRNIFNRMHEKKRLKEPVDSLMSRLTVVSEFGDNFNDVDLVIEAVFEDLKVKEQVYGDICKIVNDDCIIVSNTSSIPLDSIAPFVKKPERFGGVHFFSPVWLMQLVEVIRGEKTNQETIDNLLSFAGAIRKRPIVCRDNPGFVVNALLFPYFLTALDFLECGNSIEDIDRAFTEFGMPVGPIRLADEIGIDILNSIMKGMGIKQDTLRNFVAEGRFGLKKSGKGFFLQNGTVDPEGLSLIAKQNEKKFTASEMQNEVLLKMAETGEDLLKRKIVEDPRMIDIGMIWGSGFPLDSGGPMKLADLTGVSEKHFGHTFYK